MVNLDKIKYELVGDFNYYFQYYIDYNIVKCIGSNTKIAIVKLINFVKQNKIKNFGCRISSTFLLNYKFVNKKLFSMKYKLYIHKFLNLKNPNFQNYATKIVLEICLLWIKFVSDKNFNTHFLNKYVSKVLSLRYCV